MHATTRNPHDSRHDLVASMMCLSALCVVDAVDRWLMPNSMIKTRLRGASQLGRPNWMVTHVRHAYVHVHVTVLPQLVHVTVY